MQIAPSSLDPDRSCKVACQDEFLRHRFYLVNGEQGYFPFGTKCSRSSENRYCVNGKCLEFGDDNVPLVESYVSLSLYRSRRSLDGNNSRHSIAEKGTFNARNVKKNAEYLTRLKRSFIYYEPINITETISPELLQSIIDSLNFQPVLTGMGFRYCLKKIVNYILFLCVILTFFLF